MMTSREMSDMADQPTIKALRLISYNVGLLAVVYAISYSGPSWFVRTEKSPEVLAQQVSLVQYLETFGPIWSILFALAGLGVILSTAVGQNLILSHGIAAGVWVSYGVAIVLGAFLSEPPSPVLSGLAALFGAVTHIGMARAWSGEGLR